MLWRIIYSFIILDKVFAEVLLPVALAIVFINFVTNRCFAKCFSSFVMVNFFLLLFSQENKYLHHNNRSYKNNFLFYKESDNSFIDVKIKLIFLILFQI